MSRRPACFGPANFSRRSTGRAGFCLLSQCLKRSPPPFSALHRRSPKFRFGARPPAPSLRVLPSFLRAFPSVPPSPALRFPPFTTVPRSSASGPARFWPSGPRLAPRIAIPTSQTRPVRRIFEKIFPESFASSKPRRTFALAKRNKAHRRAREATIFERLT